MRMNLSFKTIAVRALCALVVMYLALPSSTGGQQLVGADKGVTHRDDPLVPSAGGIAAPTSKMPPAIVIGFVGGFVKSNDRKHREVQFAAHLRQSYSRDVYAEVFGNHQGSKAFERILLLLDSNHDGVLTASEKHQARIIIYGHSWGASEALKLARELDRDGIPVQLTVMIDSVAKPGEDDSMVPPNVANAVNFYQRHGLIHGLPEIKAIDPTQTKILGNYQMTYKGHPVNCNAFPWYSRFFTRSHLEIENDPRVWNQVSSLIDAQLAGTKSEQLTASLPQTP
jgi:hypothetical protein